MRETIFPDPPPPQLPAETQTGKNTLGCRINGALWRPFRSPFAGPSLGAVWLVENGGTQLNIFARNQQTTGSQSLSLRLHNVWQTGTYPLGNGRPYYVEFDDGSPCQGDTLSSQQSGQVEITRFDPVARIVSGRFEFTLQPTGCPTIQATEGRFDVTF
ncbi:hypothetical protein GCM10027346_42520 [Hymenobacter seoulensis]